MTVSALDSSFAPCLEWNDYNTQHIAQANIRKQVDGLKSSRNIHIIDSCIFTGTLTRSTQNRRTSVTSVIESVANYAYLLTPEIRIRGINAGQSDTVSNINFTIQIVRPIVSLSTKKIAKLRYSEILYYLPICNYCYQRVTG